MERVFTVRFLLSSVCAGASMIYFLDRLGFLLSFAVTLLIAGLAASLGNLIDKQLK